MKMMNIFCCLLFISLKLAAQQPETVVFQSGNDGYASYRIPAIIKAPNGSLLAFSEGRVNDAGDFGNVDIVLKRSSDQGKTWDSLKIVVDNGKHQAGNPAPVVDLTDPKYPKGRIFLFYNTGNNHEGEVRKGTGYREVWYTTSTNEGSTWSAPVNITTSVHRLKQPSVSPFYNYKEDWRSYANTPGHAMQIPEGKLRGRIFIAANHSAGEPQKQFEDYTAHGFYTDDHGKTFQLSQNVALPGSNESTAAYLGGTTLVMNSRNQKGDVKQRIVSISSNGGKTWDTTFFDSNLPDPVNEGSLLSFKKGKKYTLAFCNTAHTTKRDNLTLRLSNDGGKSWHKDYVVAASPADYKGNSYAAYSDIVLVNQNTIGVLYEKDGYREIVYQPVAIE